MSTAYNYKNYNYKNIRLRDVQYRDAIGELTYILNILYRLNEFTKCDMLSDTSGDPEITDLSDTTDFLVCNIHNVNFLH
ncbi:conserved hypothetical protein [Xenorhabdus nematophila F1]|uniref:Uncharacterized protein n=1 Tax=Xenorhabdus nematophila (strain ATCC 19061 / DSM 3370 / CCUG 14189 / LMG 1036 / NCIMB 9965 / AN6) TaxID=406817 RepID=D3VHX0_XENNA|nr:hypothetical protein D3790_13935 [Xenorhabdus nematophila]CBJ88459.1 hypothetical protein XNC1_0382 [Xenorhabdus nematophila ATCC 19061]CCW29735.1 conserved hypothetical protein [Xenorhabdus nematophila F1]CEE90131.1 hypothetical protein XNA1_120018 [Xenorhabdus nematophila str. Anatoliense]CEF31645.1 hypothetical protein XNW1_3850139 [Xenorhabdus nematophila str. Websteri]CEK21373.1 hypothetical protein XNC2_0374 [Xenorhabdus nematophila AN6/1]